MKEVFREAESLESEFMPRAAPHSNESPPPMDTSPIDPVIQLHRIKRLRFLMTGVLVWLIGLYASSLLMRREARYERAVYFGSITCSDRDFCFVHGSGGWVFEWLFSDTPLPAGKVHEGWDFTPIGSEPIQWLPQCRYMNDPPGVPRRLFIPLWPLPLLWLASTWFWMPRPKRKGVESCPPSHAD